MTVFHWFGVGFIAYACLSLRWTPNFYDSIHGIWIAMIWAVSFWLGSSAISLRELWKGLALGLSVSSVVAIFQTFGYHPVLTNGEGFSGLFYNSTVMGACSALILIALVSHKLWIYIPGTVPCLLLSNSRGAWLVLCAAALCRLHWALVILFVLASGIALYFYQAPSDVIRLHIWKMASQNFSWTGLGIGTFTDLWFKFQGQITHPEFAHNDYVQLWFECGVAAFAIFAIFAHALYQTDAIDWPVFVAFAVMGLFYFPLSTPLTAFIGCVVAGHLIGSRIVVRHDGRFSRYHFFHRIVAIGSTDDRSCGKAFPLGS